VRRCEGFEKMLDFRQEEDALFFAVSDVTAAETLWYISGPLLVQL
jgi:hypothetical protein